MVSHFEMEGPLHYRQLRNYANQCNIHVRTIWHPRYRFNPLEEYDHKDVRLHFRLGEELGSDLVKILDKGLATLNKERSAAYTNAASANCFKILCDRNFPEDYRQFYLVFLYLLHAQSFTRFQGLLQNKKDNCCHSQRTWLIPLESFMMLHIFHFSLFSFCFFTFHFTFHFL